MKDRIDEGSWGWKQRSNNNRLIAFQEGPAAATQEGVELSYFGSSCFRITTPAGLSVLIDPWRNPPWGNWDWRRIYRDWSYVAGTAYRCPR